MKLLDTPNANFAHKIVAVQTPFSVAIGRYFEMDENEIGYAVLCDGVKEPLLVIHPFAMDDLIAELELKPPSSPHYFSVIETDDGIEIKAVTIVGRRRGDAILSGGISFDLNESKTVLALLKEALNFPKGMGE